MSRDARVDRAAAMKFPGPRERARLKIAREHQIFSDRRLDDPRRASPTLSATDRECTKAELYSTLPAPRRKSASICNREPPPKRAR